MENEEVMRRRREKILARIKPSDQQQNEIYKQSSQEMNNTIQYTPVEKLKIINKMDQIKQRNRKINIILSVIFGLLCGLLNIFTSYQLQFILIWGTLLFVLSSFQNVKLTQLEKQIKNNDAQTQNFINSLISLALGKYIKNPKILRILLDNSDFIIKIIKYFQGQVEGLLLFTFFFLSVHIVHQTVE